jgi:hypothetical protein
MKVGYAPERQCPLATGCGHSGDREDFNGGTWEWDAQMAWSILLLCFAAWAAAVSGLTALAVMFVGRRLAKRNRTLAILVCGAAVPMIVPAIAAALGALNASKLPPPNDDLGMLFFGIASFCLLAAPISFATSWRLLLRSRMAG